MASKLGRVVYAEAAQASGLGAVVRSAAQRAGERVYFGVRGGLECSAWGLEALRVAYAAVASVDPELDAVPALGVLAETPDAAILGSGCPEPSVRIRGDSIRTDVDSLDWDLARDGLGAAKVAVGGTFDRLHAGHRLLLAAACVAATETMYIGVAGDALLTSKQHAKWLQPMDVRVQNVLDFLQRTGKRVDLVVSHLLDPKVPPRAATDPDITRLVCSLETLAGAHKLVAQRAANGIDAPLHLVVVGLLDDPARPGEGNKLSSTAIRRRLDQQASSSSREERQQDKEDSSTK